MIFYWALALPIIFIHFKMFFAASDINSEQLTYLADHLSLEECRQFVASLSIPSYEFPTNIANGVIRLDPEDSCLELLEKWNSGPGKIASHSILATRLIQTGHSDLSLWLSSSVFQQLTEKLEAAIEGEDSKDSKIAVNTDTTSASISIIKKTQDPKVIKERVYHDKDDDDDDDITTIEFMGSLVLMAIMVLGYFRVYRNFCRSPPNNTNQ